MLTTIYLANNLDYAVHAVSAEPLGDGRYKVRPNLTVGLGASDGAVMTYYATLEEATACVEATLLSSGLDAQVIKLKLGHLSEAP